MGASLGAGSEVLSNYTKKLLLLKYHIRAMPSFPKQISFIVSLVVDKLAVAGSR